jgi:hypothetical protein
MLLWAAAAASGPGLLSRLGPGAALASQIQRLQGLSRQAQAAPSLTALADEGRRQPAVPVELQRMLEQAAVDPQSFSTEERQILSEIKDVSDFSSTSMPVLEDLARMQRRHTEQVSGLIGNLRSWWADFPGAYAQLQPMLKSWLWAVPGTLVLLAVLGIFTPWSGLTRAFAGLGFGVSRLWLWLVAGIAATLAIFAQVNVWLSLPAELIVPPAVCLLVSTLLLKLNDMNYPVWNSLLKGCLAPIGSALLAVGIQTLRSFL